MRLAAEEPPALAYLEQSFAAAYRADLAQEDQLWRAVPLISLGIALTLAALLGAVPLLTPPAGFLGWVACFYAAIGLLSALMALVCLAGATYPRSLLYLADESELLTYAQTLLQREQDHAKTGIDDPFSALVTLKTEMARQYASAIGHNRLIHQKRDRYRAAALLALLAATTALAALGFTLLLHRLLG